MNQSIISSNVALEEAYQHFRKGRSEQALEEFRKALKNTYTEDLKANIKCTMAVLEQSLGNYDQAKELLAGVVSSKNQSCNSITLLRIYVNLSMF
jgi:predicted negative regulator of RcsB-dependent stress response